MATPHVAGAAAVHLAGHTSATPAEVATALVNGATTGKITSPGSGSPNRLLKIVP
jgi:subtilisin family serine protease